MNNDDAFIFGAPTAPKGPIDFSAIHAMFNSATANGLKKPRFRAENGLFFSLAPATGRNPGAIYIKNNDTDVYYGMVVENKFKPNGRIPDDVMDIIRKVAANPMGEAKEYGHKTGECCMCGRELTNAVSVRLGIGPICGGRWGFYSAEEADALENETDEPVGKFSDIETATTPVSTVSAPVTLECSRVMVENNGMIVVDTDECVLEYVVGAPQPFRTFIRNAKGETRWFEMFADKQEACKTFNANRADRRHQLEMRSA